jgi:hypothetical protein
MNSQKVIADNNYQKGKVQTPYLKEEYRTQQGKLLSYDIYTANNTAMMDFFHWLEW